MSSLTKADHGWFWFFLLHCGRVKMENNFVPLILEFRKVEGVLGRGQLCLSARHVEELPISPAGLEFSLA